MKSIARPDELRERVSQWRRNGERIAFVPTMGNLHAGHGSLVSRAAQLAERVIVSVFVNPLQFGPNEDFAAYPRTPRRRSSVCSSRCASSAVRARGRRHLSARPGTTARVHVPGLEDILCGAFRPGHFMGVATVVDEAAEHGAARRRVVRREGLSAADDHSSRGDRSVHADGDRRCADDARGGRPGDEFAQSISACPSSARWRRRYSRQLERARRAIESGDRGFRGDRSGGRRRRWQQRRIQAGLFRRFATRRRCGAPSDASQRSGGSDRGAHRPRAFDRQRQSSDAASVRSHVLALAACCASAHCTCSRTSAEGSFAPRMQRADALQSIVGALPSATAMLRNQHS